MISGLMRGCQDRTELADSFLAVCGEVICCPNILQYYAYGDFDSGNESKGAILSAMRDNIQRDDRYVLEYYIAHLLHLMRQHS
jgi:hypothetical protein